MTLLVRSLFIRIDKLSNEIEILRKNQNLINESNRGDHKQLNSEVEQLKNQIISYQSNLANQTCKVALLEKEVAIFRTPSTNTNNNNELTEIKSAVKKSKLDSCTSLEEVQYPDSIVQNENIVSGKMQENLNFMICVKIVII